MKPPSIPKKGPSILVLVMVLTVACTILYSLIHAVKLSNVPIISYTQFSQSVETGAIKAILLPTPHQEEYWVQIKKHDGGLERVLIPPNGLQLEKLLQHNITIDQQATHWSRRLLSNFNQLAASGTISLLILLAFLFWRIRGDNDKSGLLNLFSPSINLDPVEVPTTGFNDVAGCDGAKSEIRELVDFFKSPEVYQRLGAKIPKGVLLSGAPGTGKTLLAKALAGEAEVPFLYYSATELEEMYVGLGAKRVRAIFERAKQIAPCIIFLDEIDAIGTNRNYKTVGNDNHLQTVNQLLTCMDGFSSHDQVIVIGSTNRPQVLDPALVRPGRFDRKIEMSAPNQLERSEILSIYLSKIQVDPAVTAQGLARGTEGFVGADLANLVNQATLLAARAKRACVIQTDFDDAYDRIVMGLCRPSSAATLEAKTRTAYHEAGHALTALVLADELDLELYKVTILARGASLGHTAYRPKFSDTSHRKIGLKSHLVTIYGGFAAESFIYGENHVSTGAQSDLATARNIAQHMVATCGFSPDGQEVPVAYPSTEMYALPQASSSGVGTNHLSEKSLEKVDGKIEGLLNAAYRLAQSILEANQSALEILKKALLEQETLSSEGIHKLFEEQNVSLIRPDQIK